MVLKSLIFFFLFSCFFHFVLTDVFNVNVYSTEQPSVNQNNEQFSNGINVHYAIQDTRKCECSQNVSSEVPYDYELYPGFSFYKLHYTPKIWVDARDTCKKDGAHLAIPNSQEEANLLVNIFKLYPPHPNTTSNHYVYIGVNDIVTKGHFVSVLGEPLEKLGFMKWATGEPEISGRGFCLSLSRDILLVDIHCYSPLVFICEKEK